jgi:hypothetical protein
MKFVGAMRRVSEGKRSHALRSQGDVTCPAGLAVEAVSEDGEAVIITVRSAG